MKRRERPLTDPTKVSFDSAFRACHRAMVRRRTNVSRPARWQVEKKHLSVDRWTFAGRKVAEGKASSVGCRANVVTPAPV
jgi:hypothetical protein